MEKEQTRTSIKRQSKLKKRVIRSKNDPLLEADIFKSLIYIFIYARAKRNFSLKNRLNRDSNRNSNHNKIVENTSILEMMTLFMTKKEYLEKYHIPNDLLFFRKFHREYINDLIPFDSLYLYFKSIRNEEFQKRFKSIRFESIALSIEGTTTLQIELEYDLINNFMKFYRSRT